MRSIITSLCAFMAIWGYGGAIGLMAGAVDLGSTVTSRLPFDSPAFAGFALLAMVAVPMTVAAVSAWRHFTSTWWITVVAGALLVAWIILQIAFIHAYEWLQPFCIIYGITLIAAGLLHAPGTRRGRIQQ
jgi:hypothetical protein